MGFVDKQSIAYVGQYNLLSYAIASEKRLEVMLDMHYCSNLSLPGFTSNSMKSVIHSLFVSIFHI